MKFAGPGKSIRVRLLLWYALVLVVAVGGFAGALYFQVRQDRLRAIDARLEAGATYLAATVRGLPPHELERRPSRERGFDAPRRPEDDRFGRPPPGDAPDGRRARREFGPPRRPPGPPGGPTDRPFSGPPAERLQALTELPGSLLDDPREPAHDAPYFVVWRADGSVLAESARPEPVERPIRFLQGAGDPPGFRWRADLRESLLLGPRGTLILVGKPAGRELGELRTFAWQIAGSGLIVLAVGLAGAWFISRSIAQPIAAISNTASEISATNLTRRIETTGIDQELYGLATVLNNTFARLEAAFERQSRFTSDASHELRTPLAVIRAHAELALSKPRSAEEYRETLSACLKATSRMATLVDGLLVLARSDAGRLDAQFSHVDWTGVIEDVVDQYRPQAEAAGIALSAQLDQPAAVSGDATLLARVSSNLLSNALRYTPAGGHVRVALARENGSAVLSVEDTGCGIPREDQGKVFERFFRADKARSRALGGYGLGLAICKSLVEAHRGTIGFTSTPNRGTRFEVRLPLVSETRAAQSPAAGYLPPPSAGSDASGSGPTEA
ncbi:MAG: HAMP domain-containing protein [Planctomycetota bacterium]|nr:MAG: HAMP domain-containing protein [Planctomycetota bacterium]